MPAYGESQISLIDARIAAYATKAAKMATVATRSPDTTSATVVFDGSSGNAQPVKCFESVVVAEGDRVGVVKFESEWIITANYSDTHLADESAQIQFSSLTDVSSTSYVDMPASPTVVYEKRRATTVMEFTVGFSARNPASITTSRVGLRVTCLEESIDYDQDVRQHVMNSINAHTYWSGTVRASSAHPVGVYTATGRWMRVAGTDVMRVDANDYVSILCREVWPS